ncbi:hypothetical protein MXD59_22485 [Frankia sp. Ag45/Mut15]|uniref:DUF7507 domain-containing protein n=1 Tax=Frankia umida TaxID=573489 RepID=A0ABT0K3X7_9ACTN|nr:hypothetical protein [Frankia umida]MCK9878498.1 hypothetical protein [Frankia umida]
MSRARVLDTLLAVIAVLTVGTVGWVGAGTARAEPAVPPELVVTAAVAPSTFTGVGQELAFTFLVGNGGPGPVRDLRVQPARTGLTPVTCAATTLPPATVTSCTASHTTTQADVDTHAFGVTVLATATPLDGGPVVLSAPASTIARDDSALGLGLHLEATITPPVISGYGEAVTYTYQVTNTGTATVGALRIASTASTSEATCTSYLLDPGATATCTATGWAGMFEVGQSAVNVTAVAAGLSADGTSVLSAAASASAPIALTGQVDLAFLREDSLFTTVGQEVVTTYVLTNNTSRILAGAGLDLDVHSPNEYAICENRRILIGASVTCQAHVLSSQAQIDAGGAAATVRGWGIPVIDLTGRYLYSSTLVHVTPYAPAPAPPASGSPALTLTTTSQPPVISTVGQARQLRHTVTNTGDVPLTVSLLRRSASAGPIVDCAVPELVLAPSEQAVCTQESSVSQSQIDAGQADSDVVAVGRPATGAPVVSDPSVLTVPRNTPGGVSLTVTPSAPTFSDVGESIGLTYTVTNNGPTSFLLTSVVDGLRPWAPIRCAFQLAPGASVTCQGSYPTTIVDVARGHVATTAVALGTTNTGPPVSSPPAGARLFRTLRTGLTVTPTSYPTTFQTTGSELTFGYQVTNTGADQLTDLVAYAANPGAALAPLTCPTTALAPGTSVTCTRTYTATAADTAAGALTTTTWAGGTPYTGPPVTSAPATLTVLRHYLALVAWPAQGSFTGAGQELTLLFSVTNAGARPLTGLTIDTGPGGPAVDCPVTTIAANSSLTCSATRTTTSADVSARSIAVTAHAQATITPTDPPLHSTPATITVPYRFPWF